MPVTPIFDAGRGFRTWHVSEIYTSPLGTGRFVPNVEDLVVDYTTGFYRVTAVDSLTGESTLDLWPVANLSGGIIEEDILLGSGPGKPSDSFRVYIDNSAVPLRMAFDTRLHIYGTQASYLKVFRGADITPSGFVISAMFDVSGFVISENIPLELVVMPGVDNVAVKTPVIGGSVEPLTDGELLTAVVYSADDNVLSIYKFLAVVTNFVLTTDAARRFVMGIDLVSPFLSPSDDHLLMFPMNMLVQSGVVQGRVRYSDATEEVLPIDGGRFNLLGFDSYVASVLGQTSPLVLTYTLQPNEYAYGVSAPLPDRFLTERFNITTVEALGAYTVKLFVVPEYTTTPTVGWKLRYFLYTLDRDAIYEVTSLINYSVGATFNPAALNTRQSIRVSLDLSLVDGSYLPYRFAQNFAITLKGSGANSSLTNYWQIEYTDLHMYGAGAFAQGSADLDDPLMYRLDMSLGLADVDDWLQRVYYPTEPLRLPSLESTPPVPTHVRVRIGPSWVRTLPIAEVLDYVTGITTPLLQGMAVRLEFYRHVGVVDFELATASITIRI